MDTIILRFRDFNAETIKEHSALLLEYSEVWWGWWRKEGEPQNVEHLVDIAEKLSSEPLRIGLFDKSKGQYFQAEIADCVFSQSGGRIESPDASKTPSYYNKESASAWFRMTKLDSIELGEFRAQFSELPLSDATLFPVDHRRHNLKVNPEKATETNSSTILHLSDLHFGSDYGFPQNDHPGKRNLLDIIVKDLKKQAPDGVGIIVVSGDLSTRGDANALFDPAIPFLRKLADSLGLEAKHVVIVPGNHDIPLDNYSHLTYEHEAAFNAFLREFYKDEVVFPRLESFILPGKTRLEILPINSVRLRSESLKNIGYTSWPLYDDLLSKHPPACDRTIRMAVLHHHLIPASNDEQLDPKYAQASLSLTSDAGSVIEGLQKHGFTLVLHGHQHVPRVSRVGRGRVASDSYELKGIDDPLFVIAGGSAGVRPERLSPEKPSNTYGILKLTESGAGIEMRSFTSAGQVSTEFRTVLGFG